MAIVERMPVEGPARVDDSPVGLHAHQSIVMVMPADDLLGGAVGLAMGWEGLHARESMGHGAGHRDTLREDICSVLM
jgi:hypothetical protein